MLHGYWANVLLICQSILTIIYVCGDCGSWANLTGRYVYMSQYLFNVMGTGPIYFTYYMEGWPLYLEYHIGTGPDMCNTLSNICELYQCTSKYYAAICYRILYNIHLILYGWLGQYMFKNYIGVGPYV